MVEKKIVIPGEEIQGRIRNNVFEEKGKRYSTVYGLLYSDGDYSRIVPLKGKYIPRREDYIVGIVTDIKFGGYTVEINSPYSSFLPSQREYDYGDVLFAKVSNVNEVKNVSLIGDRKLYEGDLIEISSAKVARVIGRKNSMLDLLKDKTGCDIFVGRNGRIWLRGENAAKAEEAILMIEKEAHTDGLTEKITKFLEANLKTSLKENKK